jgi:hypothetical protein
MKKADAARKHFPLLYAVCELAMLVVFDYCRNPIRTALPCSRKHFSLLPRFIGVAR